MPTIDERVHWYEPAVWQLKILREKIEALEALVDRARHIIANYDEWDDVLPNECIDRLRTLLEDDNG